MNVLLAVRDLDDYYELTYRAAGAGDGKFHAVRLHVTRPGAQIRMRSGYWAPSPEMLRLAAGPTPRAIFATRPPHSSPLIRPWVGTSRGSNGLTSVVVTHDMRLAEKLANHIIFLDRAKVIFSGTTVEMERSSEPVVRQFLELDRFDTRALLSAIESGPKTGSLRRCQSR